MFATFFLAWSALTQATALLYEYCIGYALLFLFRVQVHEAPGALACVGLRYGCGNKFGSGFNRASKAFSTRPSIKVWEKEFRDLQ